MVSHSIDVNRPAAVVFAYLERFERHAAWQPSLISAHVETEGPIRVGTPAYRRVGRLYGLSLAEDHQGPGEDVVSGRNPPNQVQPPSGSEP